MLPHLVNKVLYEPSVCLCSDNKKKNNALKVSAQSDLLGEKTVTQCISRYDDRLPIIGTLNFLCYVVTF